MDRYLKPLEDKIIEIMSTRDYEYVIWLGYNPLLPQLLPLIDEMIQKNNKSGKGELHIVDNNPKLCGKEIVTTLSPSRRFYVEDINSIPLKRGLYLMANTHQNEFEQQIAWREIGEKIENLFDYTRRYWGIEDSTNGFCIPFLVVILGQKCNLKCKNCGNFNPYMPSEYDTCDISRTIEDLETILDCVDTLDDLQIQGGEPFLYERDLIELLSYLNTRSEVKNVFIATNGTINISDSLIEILKRTDTEVRISEYGLFERRINKLKEKLMKNGIRYRMYPFSNGKTMWYYKGLFDVNEEQDNQLVNRRFNECLNHHCLTLDRGKLFYCSRACNAHLIQKFEPDDSDYLKINKDANFNKLFVEYVKHRHFMRACRFCNGTDDNFLCIPAEQL